MSTKGLVKACLFLLLFSTAHADDSSLKPPVMKERTFPAPNLRLVGLDGKSHTLSEFLGRVVLLNIWGTWCPGCLIEMPTLERLTEMYEHDPQVVIVLASLNDSPDKIIAFRAKHHCHSRMFLLKNDDLPLPFQLHSYPETFLIDRDGVVKMEHVGAADWSSAPVVSCIERLKHEAGLI